MIQEEKQFNSTLKDYLNEKLCINNNKKINANSKI